MPIANWGGINFLAIDPGVNVTGLAVYKTDASGVAALINCRGIVPHASLESEHLRTAYIVDTIQGIVQEYRPAFAYVEQPPFTIYHQKFLNKTALIARAQSVFKTVAVCFSILTYLRTGTRVRGIPVFPSQWQFGKKQRLGLDSKEWSLKLANEILSLQPILERPLLFTQKDENIADAICLGKLAYQKGILP